MSEHGKATRDAVNKARSDLANTIKKSKKAGGPPHAEVEKARRTFAAGRLAAEIRKTVESAPTLTPAQKDKLAALLRGGA